ncbi:hypothetical protein ACJJIF_09945 [Microbulbifer sp. SSSA002]|uniref:hypothetical protein n=1 Tax=Microbulbifer sp. SSSA002 TaxID=3243376 RepID=UPI00403A1CC8
MPANKPYLRLAFFFLCTFIASSCNSEASIESKEVINLASRNVLKSTNSYSEQVSQCNELIDTTTPPILNKKKLNDLKATRENILTAIAFIKYKNDFLCERSALLELTFHLGTIENIKKELKLDSSSSEKLQSIISFPSVKELELEVKYLNLPKEQRTYYESKFSDKPFDLIKALELNGIMKP